MKNKFLIFLGIFIFMILPKNVFAADSWTGTNWASTYPSRFEVFMYQDDNGTVTYPNAQYGVNPTSAFGFSGFTTASGWGGYYYNYLTGTDYRYLTYTNSFNIFYLNRSFTSAADYVTIKGQIFPANQSGKDILNILNWYIVADYGGAELVSCQYSKGSTGGTYYANFQCSFPRTTYLNISLRFNNYTGSNQGAKFMIRSDWSDIMYSDDNTPLITNSISANADDIINNQNLTTSMINDTINTFKNTITNIQNQVVNNTANIDNTMKDDNVDTTYQNSTLDNLNSQMASNNVISDLLLLPVRMYQKILDSLDSNSCTSYNLGSLYDTNLVLPCIQVQNYIGSALWTTIDLIFCGMFILVIRKKFVDIFNNMTNLKDRGNDIE